MKLSKDAQELVASTLTKPGVRAETDELASIFSLAGMFAVSREESTVSKSAMADALDASNYLDAEVLGCSDAYNWADEANRNYSTTFGIECFTRISEGLDAVEQRGPYLRGWARGVRGFAASLRRGAAIGKRVA